MSQFSASLTLIGVAKTANAFLMGNLVPITEFAVGDGEDAQDVAATELQNEVFRAAITSLNISAGNLNTVEVIGIIPPSEGGFTIREIGLFDEDGDLIAIGNLPESFKPTLESGSGVEMQIKTYVIVANAAGVLTLKIDPAVVMASRAYVDAALIAFRDGYHLNPIEQLWRK